MEDTRRRSLVRYSWLLQAALLAMVGYIPSSLGIDCYCSEEPYNGLPLCYWNDYKCSGDQCYVRRWQQGGVIYTKWGCLRYAEHHVSLLCGGAFDQDNERYVCCNGTVNCNGDIVIVLPIEFPNYTTPVVSTSAPSPATTVEGSSGSGEEGHSSSPLLPSVTTEPTDLPTTTDIVPSQMPESLTPKTSTQELVPTSVPTTTSTSTPTTTSASTSTTTTSPDLPHLKCYCSGSPSNEVTCGLGGSCFVHEDYMLDQAGDGVSPFSLSSGCLNASEAAIKCHGRSKDYKCCSNEDYCNKQLLSDRRDPTTPLSDECNSVSGGCQTSPLQDKFLVYALVAVLISIVLIVMVVVFIIILWIHIFRLKQRKAVNVASSVSESTTNSVTTESESLSGPISTATTHHYLCIAHVDERVFGETIICNGSRA